MWDEYRQVADVGYTNIIYLDESMEGNLHILSALSMPVHAWKRNLDALIALRRVIRDQFGVFMGKEIHTSEFLGGRGRYAKGALSKSLRAEIYRQLLRGGAGLQEVALFNAVSSKKQVDWAFERLLNRFQRNVDPTNGHFLIVSDTGQEYLYPRICRLRRRYNPIPNRGLDGYQNRPVTRLIEDPVFVRSDKSYFIQLVDMIAYALLRKEKPHPSGRDPFGIGGVFREDLGHLCVREANASDEYGIIRVPFTD